MKAAIILSVLALTLLGFFASGCAKNAPETVITPNGEAENAVDNSISGDILSVDSLDSELSGDDLGDVDAQLDEIDW